MQAQGHGQETDADTSAMQAQGRETDARDSSDQFSDVGEVIEDPLFWSYCSMLLHCSRILDDFAAWAEGCSCHPSKTLKSLVSEFQTRHGEQKTFACPMAGCRGPELASGLLRP